MSQELTAGCKVNLYLDIVGVRADGYHEIESLFYPLPSPCDVLTLAEGGEGFRLTCSDPSLAAGENILTRAYERFAGATGFAPGLAVHLDKGIPMGAGLGGGSSDAATLLRWLNGRAGDKALSSGELADLALSLGADVPFFLDNVPAWVTGIGEVLEPVPASLDDYVVLVVCPQVHVNTAWAYRRYDEMLAQGLVRPRKELTLNFSPIKNLCFTKPPELWNSFEEVVFQEFPVLYGIKELILDGFADACVMSGSGSSFVALFSSSENAARCAGRLRSLGHACFGIRSGRPVRLDS
ncbi:MAG TPA: 4-(cytidine 5'-diphospho)-2-C-methyl-D-erythritol kinase [Desulfomicrobium sp.]|nr:4-(cytidine 5'-diphospho)-2-C-methyl-D-erythritol kinase [Desulfomicrobium sp.]